MTCAVLVPSFGRPADLGRCLDALLAQSVPPDQVIVVVRKDDAAGRSVVAARSTSLPITEVLSHRPGQVAALNVGLDAVRCDVTAITDDDAAPQSDWIERLLFHFADRTIAAAGGRDIVVWQGAVIGVEDGLHPVVGRVGWYGRVTGNHHRGDGPPRQVDALKGANMAFRTDWLRRIGFDERLRGTGAQVHNDLMVCLAIRRAGGAVLYDPGVRVFHYPAPRPAGDSGHDRRPATMGALTDEVHNETLALMAFLSPWRRMLWMTWAVALGTRRKPGLGMGLVLCRNFQGSLARTLLACYRGRVAGVATWRATKALE